MMVKFINWLVVDANPWEKWWSSSVGVMTFPIWWENNVPKHQPEMHLIILLGFDFVYSEFFIYMFGYISLYDIIFIKTWFGTITIYWNHMYSTKSWTTNHVSWKTSMAQLGSAWLIWSSRPTTTTATLSHENG